MQAYSVLMSVYFKEKPDHLLTSMTSILNQSVKTDDFVLVCDGPLNSGLDDVIAGMQTAFGDRLHVIRLEKNQGLGRALNTGMKHCRHSLIARMDSDDISYPDRCEKQLALFDAQPDLDICSGIVEEFSTTPDVIENRRVPPETQDDILAFVKKRNPFNHPCVMYRKEAVEAAGGYQDFYLLEDYYLWIRMLQQGAHGYNLQEPILWMRAGSDMYKRRAGWKYAKSQARLFRYMRSQGMISRASCQSSIVVRGVSSMLPNGIRKALFEKKLRK